jgi:hypothetical protein
MFNKLGVKRTGTFIENDGRRESVAIPGGLSNKLGKGGSSLRDDRRESVAIPGGLYNRLG